MATGEVGQLTIALKFDGKDLSASINGVERQLSTAGQTSGSKFATAMSVAAGTLLAKGFSTITTTLRNNFDSAISRVDTLNAFPKVMKNLGLSSKQADKVINEMAKSLIGLPTKLDDAASAVQRMVAKNGDLKKSKNIFLALNNAILAGTPKVQKQNAALEQMQQAYARGKMSMQDWKPILDAMPGQMKQVAQSMGMSLDEMAYALGVDNPGSPTISMEKLMDQIVKLDKEGTGKFASFSKQARASTGGIKVASDNVQNAVTRAISDVMKAIGPKVFANAAQNTINRINAIAKAMVDLIKWSRDNSETLKIFGSVVAGVGAALVTANIASQIQKIMQVASLSSGLGSFANNLSRLPGILGKVGAMATTTGKGFGSLFGVIKANPVIAIVAAIVTALAIFFTQTETGRALLQNIMGTLSSTFANIYAVVKPILGTIGTTFNNIVAKIGPTIAKVFSRVADVFGKVVEKLMPLVEQLFPALGPLVDSVAELFSQLAISAFEIINALIPLFTELVNTLLLPIMSLIQQIIPVVSQLFQKIMPVIIQLVQSLLPIIVTMLQVLLPIIVVIINVLSQILTVIISIFTKVLSFLLPIIINVITSIITAIISIINIVMVVITTIIKAVTNIIQFITAVVVTVISFISAGIAIIRGFFIGLWTRIVAIFSGVGEFFKSVFQNAWNAITSIFGNIGNFFRGVWNTITGIFTRIGTTIGNAVGGAFRGVVNGVLAMAERVINGPINAINAAIGAINKLPGVNIGKISRVSLPRMATGGMVNATTTAIIGEAGREVVLPLDKNTEWAKVMATMLADEMEVNTNGDKQIIINMNNNINNKLDAEEIGQLMMTSIRRAA